MGLCSCYAAANLYLPRSVSLMPPDGVLHLAFYLVALALGFQLGIAQYLASNFLHFALGLFRRTFDAVFVQVSLLCSYYRRATLGQCRCDLVPASAAVPAAAEKQK